MFPTRILVATDGSGEAVPAVEAAVELANGTGSELHIVYVVSTVPELPYPSVTTRERTEAILEQRRLGGLGLLERQTALVEELGGIVAASHYREGVPEKEVRKLGQQMGAGMIVTGGRKRPWFERVFGRGFSTTLLRNSDRPVLVVNERGLKGSVARSG